MSAIWIAHARLVRAHADAVLNVKESAIVLIRHAHAEIVTVRHASVPRIIALIPEHSEYRTTVMVLPVE